MPNFILSVAGDWISSFPVDRLPMEPTPCPRGAIQAWEARHTKIDPEIERRMRETLGDELYEKIRNQGTGAGAHSVALRDSGLAPFLEYWDGHGFGPLGGFTMSARSAVLEFLDATMVICSENWLVAPVDPKTLPRN